MVLIEQEIERAILAQKRWADLDNRMRDLIGSSQEYDKKILRYSVENQLRYRGNLVRFVVNDEREYYRELLKYSRDHLMLFPYHLSDFIITGMRFTPFQYYISTLEKIIEQEKSYDTLPNFTAADCLRLLGIGRNQYIDIMNKLRSTYKSFLGIVFKPSPRNLLPDKPVENVPIEPWWFVNAGYVTEDDVRLLSQNEKVIIDQLISPDGLSNQILACDLDERHVRSLYLRGLIYLDVPIYDDDFIVVPPLKDFVMNRVTGDYFETLLYKIFVSIDQNTPVRELANILEIDIRLVKMAVSMYCRLRFAYKKNIFIDIQQCHPTWRTKLDSYRELGINVAKQETTKSSRQISDFIKELASVEEFDHGTEVVDNPSGSIGPDSPLHVEHEPAKDFTGLAHSPSNYFASHQQSAISPSTHNVSTGSTRKVVFFYDSNLAAFLMMGNLSTQLKNHAVTMFEVGKLSDEWIDSLLAELSKIKADILDEDGYEAKRYYTHALMLHRTIQFIRTDLKLASGLLQCEANKHENQRVGLDLIRVESLSNLDTESCERFLKKNYQLIISVAPLNQDVKLNAASCLPHLGPGSPLINSLWFRLYIYHITGYGPPSMLLVQGYRLESLPAVFYEYGGILMNHWNREPTCVSANNALPAINEALTHSPVLVQAYPLHPVGSDLMEGDEKVYVPLPPMQAVTDNTQNQSIEHKLIDVNSSPSVKKLVETLKLQRVCGYITLLRSAESLKRLAAQRAASEAAKPQLDTVTESSETCQSQDDASEETAQVDFKEYILFDCHFGVPLFDRFLNKEVRNRISSQNLCDSKSLAELIQTTRQLNDDIAEFVDQHTRNNIRDSIDTSNAGDQRHFFFFPDTEQFRCAVPRPAKNLLFSEGTLVAPQEFD